MPRLTPDDLRAFIDDLEGIRHAYWEVINSDERIRHAFIETQSVAKLKYAHLVESDFRKTEGFVS